MKKFIFKVAFGAAVCLAMMAQDIQAQDTSRMVGGDPGPGRRGPYPARAKLLRNAAFDRAHPHPFFAHGRGGINATRTHMWNAQMAPTASWHGGYYYPRFGRPTALVVPPTVATQTVYSWGVGRTMSLPVYHQYGREGGMYGGTGGTGFSAPPYWPSSTTQFGIYPVRAPW